MAVARPKMGLLSCKESIQGAITSSGALPSRLVPELQFGVRWLHRMCTCRGLNPLVALEFCPAAPIHPSYRAQDVSHPFGTQQHMDLP